MTVTHRVPKGTFHKCKPIPLILSDADAPARSRGGDAPKPPACTTARVCEQSRTYRFGNPDRWNDSFNDGSRGERAFPEAPNSRCTWIKANRSRKHLKAPTPYYAPAPEPLPPRAGAILNSIRGR